MASYWLAAYHYLMAANCHLLDTIACCLLTITFCLLFIACWLCNTFPALTTTRATKTKTKKHDIQANTDPILTKL